MKKAGIYDRWLHTLGGGEQHTITIAQSLAQLGYSVEIITHRKTNLDKLQKKFGINRLNFKIKYLPEMWDYELTPYTKQYDLFVMSSFADICKSEAKKSILSVFFPTELKLSLKDYLTRAIVVPLVRYLFQFPLYIQYNHDNTVTIATNKKSNKITFSLHFPELAISVIEQIKVKYLDTELKTQIKVNHKKNILYITATSDTPMKQWELSVPASQYSKFDSLKLRFNLWNRFGNKLINIIPSLRQRFSAGPRKFSKDELLSYNKIVSISAYTAKWVESFWNLESDIIHPPVNIRNFISNAKKKKWIVSIGRFFVSGHNKNQLEMVQAFKKISKQIPDWELHLIGSVDDAPTHREYYQSVLSAAKGYPIFIHKDIPFEDLKNILSQSSIYWHAAGLTVNENTDPEKLEHFGLTIIEAMASGCVPMVVNKGGPKEIAINTGVTWESLEDLSGKTIQLIKMNDFDKFQKDAILASKLYTHSRYLEKLKKLLKEI